jgi:predicted nucleic acid-binding protein
MKKNRIYADTSVFGGVFDPEFAGVSTRFFDEVRRGRHILLVSDITQQELEDAPLRVRQVLVDLPENMIETHVFNREMGELREAYLSAKVVERRWRDDASHVAVATVVRADLIVSWNFRHMVKWEKIRAFNAVNLVMGYPMVTILSPREVISDEKDL